MRALTILNPWAALSAAGLKPVENRSWSTRYRGLLALHAGRSRAQLDRHPLPPGVVPAFGAFVAVAQLSACLTVAEAHALAEREGWPAEARQFIWGPVCWILADVRKLAEPILYCGRQGLWRPSKQLICAVRDLVARRAVERCFAFDTSSSAFETNLPASESGDPRTC